MFKLGLTAQSVKLEGVQGLWEKGEKRKKKKPSKLVEGEEDVSASDNLSISHGRLEMSHHVHVGGLWLRVFHLLVLISTCHLDSWLFSGGPGEPGAGREGLSHQPYAPHLVSCLIAQRGVKGGKMVRTCACVFTSVCAFAANIFHPNGGGGKRPTGLPRSFSHLRSSASQMAAMLMNPTGCYDTTASGRSKWGFGVEQVCVRVGVCVEVCLWSTYKRVCGCVCS